MKVLSVDQVRALDRGTIEHTDLDGLDLMERAGCGVFEALDRFMGYACRVWVFAGKGNNGGDAFVVARYLIQSGYQVSVFLCFDPATIPDGDAKVMLDTLEKLEPDMQILTPENIEQLDPSECDVIVDGILGTGLKSSPRGIAAGATEFINSSKTPVIAIDVPTGMDADTGKILAPCVKADLTVTMGAAKHGFFKKQAANHTGRILVTDIGFLPEMIEDQTSALRLILPQELDTAALIRFPIMHKSQCGRVLVAGASAGLCGALSLTALAAARSGAGLVTAGVANDLMPIFQTKLTEVMCLGINGLEQSMIDEKDYRKITEFKADAICVGPGMGRSAQTVKLLENIISNATTPLVLDADALWAVGQNPEMLKTKKTQLVLTPHEGEMAYLTGLSSQHIHDNRQETASEFAKKYEVTLVLKGHHTLISDPWGNLWVNLTGGPALATGGAGDVLAGICTAFIAQKVSPVEAAKAAVYVHGLASDMFAFDKGENGMIASDIITHLPEAIETLTRKCARNVFIT